MAFAGMLFAFFGVIAIILGICLLFGSVFLIVALAMRSKAAKDPEYDENGKVHIKKWYLIPGGISVLFFLPLLISVAVIVCVLVSESISNSKNLSYQVMHNNYHQAEKLLKSGVSPDCTLDSNKPAAPGEKTLLMIMSEAGGFVDYAGDPVDDVFTADEEKMMKLLIDNGADLESVYYCHEENFSGHEYVTETDYYYYSDGCGRTPLLEAAANGNFDVVKFLVDEGADITAHDYTGYGIVETIADNLDDDRGYEMLVFAVDNGARTDGITKLGQDAYFLAWRHNDRDSEKIQEYVRQ